MGQQFIHVERGDAADSGGGQRSGRLFPPPRRRSRRGGHIEEGAVQRGRASQNHIHGRNVCLRRAAPLGLAGSPTRKDRMLDACSFVPSVARSVLIHIVYSSAPWLSVTGIGPRRVLVADKSRYTTEFGFCPCGTGRGMQPPIRRERGKLLIYWIVRRCAPAPPDLLRWVQECAHRPSASAVSRAGG